MADILVGLERHEFVLESGKVVVSVGNNLKLYAVDDFTNDIDAYGFSQTRFSYKGDSTSVLLPCTPSRRGDVLSSLQAFLLRDGVLSFKLALESIEVQFRSGDYVVTGRVTGTPDNSGISYELKVTHGIFGVAIADIEPKVLVCGKANICIASRNDVVNFMRNEVAKA